MLMGEFLDPIRAAPSQVCGPLTQPNGINGLLISYSFREGKVSPLEASFATDFDRESRGPTVIPRERTAWRAGSEVGRASQAVSLSWRGRPTAAAGRSSEKVGRP